MTQRRENGWLCRSCCSASYGSIMAINMCIETMAAASEEAIRNGQLNQYQAKLSWYHQQLEISAISAKMANVYGIKAAAAPAKAAAAYLGAKIYGGVCSYLAGSVCINNVWHGNISLWLNQLSANVNK